MAFTTPVCRPVHSHCVNAAVHVSSEAWSLGFGTIKHRQYNVFFKINSTNDCVGVLLSVSLNPGIFRLSKPQSQGETDKTETGLRSPRTPSTC